MFAFNIKLDVCKHTKEYALEKNINIGIKWACGILHFNY